MSRGVNKAILLGHLGKYPEVRHTKGGSAICNFSLATSRSYKSGEEWKEETDWHNVVAFGKVAEACGKHLQKGSQVFIEGRIQTRKWQDKDGNTRYTTEVVATDVQFLGGGQKREAQEPRNGYEDQPGFPESDDVPF